MFEILHAPSGNRILARGSSRNEALTEAARGLSSVMVNPEGVGDSEKREFHAHGNQEDVQIVNWLNEILFFFDTEGLVLTEFSIDSWTEQTISGHARGAFFEPLRHEFRRAVKAVTHRQFESHSIADGWQIRVVVDF